MSKNKLTITQAAKTADIYIYGDLYPYDWDGDVSAQSIVDQIKDLDVDVINVHIDSYGGSVSEGWAIYSALVAHKAKVVTYGDGFVASAALFPFLAGDQRIASTLSGYYFHQVMSGAYGYANDLRKAAEEAEKLTDIGIQAFVERAGMDEALVRKLMSEETWVSPQEAKDYGLATSILEPKTDPNASQSAKRAIFARLASAKPAPSDPTTEPVTIMQTLAKSLEQ